ncbi:MAG: ABC transporter substrate-binding protein [Chloroflexota bacterium]
MSTRKALSRREFLRLSAMAAGAATLAACAPQPPATSTQTAAAPTKAAAPAAPAAATAPPKASEPKLGASLVGKLEGPEILRDPAKFPKSFKEAPQLAEMVKASKLPPVEQRLPAPEDVMVVKPVHETGKYGGTWRRGFTGPGDGENGNRIVSTDKILFWDFTATKYAPSVAKDWKVSDDGKTTTIYLRKGMKWSDGQPFTANDFVFWYEEIYLNKELVTTPTAELSANGKQGKLKEIDDYTVAFEFEDPNYLFVDILAGSTLIGGGQATRQAKPSNFFGSYTPAHYVKQFLPKFTPQERLDKQAKDAGFDSWKSLLKFKMDWQLNPELPTVTPWKTTGPINTPNWVLERNPYYWVVDTEGNQLPYVDKIVMTMAENLEVLNLRAIAGEYEEQERHTDMQKLPVFLENQKKGNYTVHLDPALNGADCTFHVNQAYEGDPEIARWLTSKDFRHALSLGLDRDQMNETFWLGTGTPGSIAPAESSPYSPGPEYRSLWATYDPKKATELLDKIGLDKKDSEGYRLRTDGKGRLRIELTTVGGMFIPYTQIAEMAREQWKKIGIQADVKEMERTLAFTRSQNNEQQIMLWANDGSEMLFLFPRHALPVDPVEAHMGAAYAKWFSTNGQAGKKPTDQQMLKAFDLFRSAASLKDQERIKVGQEIWKILVEETWGIGTVGQSPAFMGVRIVSNKLGNVPARQVNAQHARTPCSSHPETFFFK